MSRPTHRAAPRARLRRGRRPRRAAADRLRLLGLQPAAARRRRPRRQPLHGHRRVPRRARPGAAVGGQGRRRHRRPGRRRRARRLHRRGDRAAPPTTSSCPTTPIAEIRQTSLLGEKFVSLAPPPPAASSDPARRRRRHPARPHAAATPRSRRCSARCRCCSTAAASASSRRISTELNNAFDGRESNVRSVLDQLDTFMGQLDDNKDQIVAGHRAASTGSRSSLNASTDDPRPGARRAAARVASINRQRDDLVKMLRALADLSSVGTQVIRASKAGTIDSLKALAPTLTEAGRGRRRPAQVAPGRS